MNLLYVNVFVVTQIASKFSTKLLFTLLCIMLKFISIFVIEAKHSQCYIYNTCIALHSLTIVPQKQKVSGQSM